jgi:hypothetical protein
MGLTHQKNGGDTLNDFQNITAKKHGKQKHAKRIQEKQNKKMLNMTTKNLTESQILNEI